MVAMQRDHNSAFVDWLSNNVKTAACNVSTHGLPFNAVFAANTTSVFEVFHRTIRKFTGLLGRFILVD